MSESFFEKRLDVPHLSIYDATLLFAEYEVVSRGVEGLDECSRQRSSIANMYNEWLIADFKEGNVEFIDIEGNKNYFNQATDKSVSFPIDIKRTKININEFFTWAEEHKIPIPEGFRQTYYDEDKYICFEDGSMHEMPDIGESSLCKQLEALKKQEEEIELDEKILQDISNADVPWLKKKVKELFNEKDKWNKSIVAAAKIGLMFYEKGLTKPATEKEFVAKFGEEFEGIHKTTVSRIYKALPLEYRNKGGSPSKDTAAIDDDTLDRIIETSIASGLLCSEDEVKDAKELEKMLTPFEFDILPVGYLKAISGACKRVSKKYKALAD